MGIDLFVEVRGTVDGRKPCSGHTGSRLLALCFLAMAADDASRSTHMKITTLATYMHVDRKIARNAVHELEASGELWRYDLPGKNSAPVWWISDALGADVWNPEYVAWRAKEDTREIGALAREVRPYQQPANTAILTALGKTNAKGRAPRAVRKGAQEEQERRDFRAGRNVL